MNGAELRQVRERLGWSQRRLAEELGYSTNYIALCERDEREISIRLERQVLLLEAVYHLCELIGRTF